MISATITHIDGSAKSPNLIRPISQSMLASPFMAPSTEGDTGSVAILFVPVTVNGQTTTEKWTITATYAATLASLTTDAAESGAEVITNKSTDFAAANRNDTKYPSTEAVYENFQPIWYGTTTGADLLYVSTLAPAPTAYAAGMKVMIMFGTTNTGASAINLNGLGAKAIRKGTGGATALSASDLVVTKIYTLIYDGTNFQIDL